MSQFKVGDVVQRVKLPHYVGVVVKLPEMWGDDKKQSYIVATITSITKKCNETFFAEDLKPYAYGVPNDNLYLEYTTGDLVTFSVKSSSGYCSEETFYVGPRENCRCVNGLWYYPFINWEDGETYYGSRYWGDVKKVVKPKLKIGDFVRLAGKASSPVVKIIYDRPYKTHVYTLENELFISETRLAEFVFDEKDKSWSHKDVKPVAKAIEKAVSTDDIKVGDVVLDRRVDCSRQLGVVIRAEHPRYTVNWLDQDCVEKLVYRGSLQLHPYLPTPNDIAYRRPNSVLVVQTGTGKEFYQIGTSEAKIIDGTWYFPYVNLHTTELRYGIFHYKRPGEVLTPKFKLGDKLVVTDDLVTELVNSVQFDIPTKLFRYRTGEGWTSEWYTEEFLSTFKKQGDTWYHPSVLEQKEKIAANCETADLMCNLINIDARSDDKPTALVTNPELDKKLSDCKYSMGNVFVCGKEEFVGKLNKGVNSFSDYSDCQISTADHQKLKEKFGDVSFAALTKVIAEKCKMTIGLGASNIAAIYKLDLPEPDPSVKMCIEQVKEWRKQWPAVEDYDNPYVACIEYANNHITKTLLETRKVHENVMNSYGMPIKDILASNSVKDTEPTGVKMNLSPVNARVIRLQSVQLLNSLSKELFTKSFSESTVANEPNKFKILGNIVDHKVPPALALSLAGFSCKYGLLKAPASVKPVLEVLQKEFTDESQAMLTHAKWQVVKLVATDIISSFVSLVQEHLENDI